MSEVPKPMSSAECVVGARVIATCCITEAGGETIGDPNAKYDAPNYVHAEAGEGGVIEHVDSLGEPTVLFDRKRTSTIVGLQEIALEKADSNRILTAP
jgi:hypothetical protein